MNKKDDSRSGNPSSAPNAPHHDAAADQAQLNESMSKVRNKILVLSGKGGVGKSAVAVNLAVALANAGRKVGLLDIDIHGPSIPKMLGIEGASPRADGGRMIPVPVSPNLKAMSIGLLLQKDSQAVIWRGPLKYSVIMQFLKDVEWGDLDYLVVDSPPGTGDEPLSICQLLPEVTGAVVVTTPQAVSVVDVKKCLSFCEQLKVPVIGIIENMAGLKCPHCGERIDLFGAGGGERLASETNLPFLASVPIEPGMVQACDDGVPFIGRFADSEAAAALRRVVSAVTGACETETKTPVKETDSMKIAIPTAEGKLCMHFGHCEKFAIVAIEGDEVKGVEFLAPPHHEPGVLPKWLNEQGANVIIASGMGQRAQGLFNQNGIKVVVGAPVDTPENLVRAHLDGSLATGGNACDH